MEDKLPDFKKEAAKVVNEAAKAADKAAKAANEAARAANEAARAANEAAKVANKAVETVNKVVEFEAGIKEAVGSYPPPIPPLESDLKKDGSKENAPKK